jgi:hypothetical protein
MKSLICIVSAAALALLASCGGGSVPVDGSALERPMGTAAFETCVAAADGSQAGVVGYQMLGAECVKTFAPLASGMQKMARPARSQSASLPQAGTAFTWATLIPWAEQAYPQYFYGSAQSGTYQDFTFRYYPASGNYIGLRNGDMVYVYGPVFDGDLLYVGTLGSLGSQAGASGASTTTPVTLSSDQRALLSWAQGQYPQMFSGTSQDASDGTYTYRYFPSTGNYVMFAGGRVYLRGPAAGGGTQDLGLASGFTCQVTPTAAGCAVAGAGGGDAPGSTASTVRLQAGSPVSASIDAAGDDDWYMVTLAANITYTFALQGASTGKGTLYDPVLRLYSAAGTQLASNDDVTYPTNRDSQLVWRATSAGTYYVSARGYDSYVGTYVLSMAAGASTGSTGGTSPGTGTGSATGTTVAPAPIYSARNLSLGTAVQLAGTGTEFFAIQLNAGTLYSFDSGSPQASPAGFAWRFYNAAGTLLTIGSEANASMRHFGWTPPSTGVYYIQPVRGTVLTVRSHGNATSNPYTADLGGILGEPFWLTGSVLFTFQSGQLTSPAFPINLHAGETYRLRYKNSSNLSGEVTLSSGSGQVLHRATLGYRNEVTQNVSVATSDTYYVRYRIPRSDPGAIFFAAADYQVDSDGDGDPDATDPYPSDPTRSSTSGSGSGTGSGTGTGGTCGMAGYNGPQDDPQTWTICAAAYSHMCNGDAANAARMCTYLTGVLAAYGNPRTAGQYCSAYCR